MRRRPTEVELWTLDFGDPEDDAVAVNPDVLSLSERSSEGFVLILEDDVESPEDRMWPVVAGDRVVWAVGPQEFDIRPVALLASGFAGDLSMLPLIARRTSSEDSERLQLIPARH